MRYFIRSVKYFFYFAILTSLILAALVITGMAEGDIETMFEGGYTAIGKMIGFFAVVAAVYPKVGFIKKHIIYDKGWKEAEAVIVSYMREHNFDPEATSGQTATFRHRSVAGRISRMLEDRITVSFNEDGSFEMEGLRKDVYRLATGIEYRLNPQQD